MRSLSDQEFVETEALLRQRLSQLADHAPTSVQMPDEISVVATHRRRRNGHPIAPLRLAPPQSARHTAAAL